MNGFIAFGRSLSVIHRTTDLKTKSPTAYRNYNVIDFYTAES